MDYVSHIAILVMLYSILGISLNLLMGYTGLMSIGHAALYGIGAYAMALLGLHLGLNFFLSLTIGIVITGVVGMIIAISALRVKAEYFVLLTLSFQMVIYGLFIVLKGVTNGNVGLPGIPRPEIFGLKLVSATSYLPLVAVLFVIAFLVTWRITHSPYGRVLKAMREDEDIAISFGKDVKRFKVLSFMVSGGLAAVAGTTFASYTTFISAQYFTADLSIMIIAIVALGGTANIWGSLVGAIIVICVPEILTFVGRGWTVTWGNTNVQIYELIDPLRSAAYGLLLIIFMRFRPQGIIPEYQRFNSKQHVDKELSPEDINKVLWTTKASPVVQKHTDSPIEVFNVSKDFVGLRAVDKLTLRLPENKITALIGPNGAGKTTLFNLITAFLPCDSGKIIYRGKEITNLQPHQISKLGVVRSFQGARVLMGISVLDNVLVARPNQSGENLVRLFFTACKVKREEKENYRFAMACLGFVGLADRSRQIAGELSFADQKMLQLACLLAMEPNVMLLDEPVSGVDLLWVDHVLGLIRQLIKMGKTVCIIEHNLDVVKGLADSAYFLSAGQVVAEGTPARLMSDQKLIELYFGV